MQYFDTKRTIVVHGKLRENNIVACSNICPSQNDIGCSNSEVINNELHEGNFGSPRASAASERYGSSRIAPRYAALFMIVQAA